MAVVSKTMTEWLVDHDWHYHYFPLDESETSFPGFASVLSLWREKGDGGFPAWSDLDFMDFQDWWGWLCVYDVLDVEVPSFKVRLWGTRIAELSGIDLTGRALIPEACTTTVDATGITLNDLRFAAKICKERLLGFNFGPHKIEYGERWMYHELSLPLSSDGECIDKLLFAGRIEQKT